MKKVLFILAALLPVAIANAGTTRVAAPLDQTGHALATIDFVGAKTCNIDTSTGAASVICYTGPAEVLGVIASSITNTQYLTFRDSATANVTSATSTVVFANGSNATASGASTTLNIKFPVPIYFTNAVGVVASAAPAGVSNWTILYRPLN